MDEKTREALKTIGLYIADDELKSNAREALAHLQAMVEEKAEAENAALKAEVEIQKDIAEQCRKNEEFLYGKLEKAEAEDHDSLRIELAHTTERAKSLEAELDAARPLLEVVNEAECGALAIARSWLFQHEPKNEDIARPAADLIDEVIAYRASKEGK